MRLSLITPTNSPRHLNETYDSLRLQGHRNFEWVLLPNGGMKPEYIPERIRQDPRVVIHQYEHKNVGALKRHACDSSTGDAFVELDHDDLLTPGALARIAKCFEDGAGFVFSDVATFSDGTLRAHAYDVSHGWTNYPIRIYNRALFATQCFPISARMLCTVHFAPDHVRAWNRQAYYRAGGHDKNLLVADDHDLVCRTYLSGAKFQHTGGCEYLYRFHANNTVGRYNKEIQTLQKANQDKYLWPLIDEECRRNEWEFKQIKRDHYWYQPLPWDDDSVGCLRAYDVLQYVPTEQLAFALNECYRVLRPGGWLCLRAPSTDGRGSWLPSYKSRWNEELVQCFCNREMAEQQLPTYRGRFQSVRCWTRYVDGKAQDKVVTSVYADLVALKDQRNPGPVYI